MDVTFQLDDELLRQAELVAARRDTSMTQLVHAALEQQVALDSALQRGGAHGAYETLAQYSLGELPRGLAMERLGIDHYGDLLGLLGAAGLPMPTVAAATRAEMTAGMIAVLEAAGQLPKERDAAPDSSPA